MNTRIRQILAILTTLFTLTINALSNALPLNGLTAGQISDSFQVYFVPGGYVFSIWGLIYIGMIAFTVYQALPVQRDNPRLQGVRGWFILSNLANAGWLFLWHYQQFPVTLLVMGTLLVSLLAICLRLRAGRASASTVERWVVDAPFSVYLGWITVATIANVTTVLDYVGWHQFGLSDAVWMVVMLAVVAVLGWLVGFIFEAGGDLQLMLFKRNPANTGQLLNSGLWALTRHPNYFGDAVQWWGFWLVATAGGAWGAIFSPLLMTYLLRNVSGVAMLEKTLKQAKPGYEEYRQSVPAFFPKWPGR